MLRYKTFAVSFSYPDDRFFECFPELSPERQKLMAEYDRLFRAKEIWLYTTEYVAKHEFQKANYLADIMGFYRAFGIEPEGDRADSFSNTLEFMYYLIFKECYALENGESEEALERASICSDAQKKFFAEHLYPAAGKIAEAILAKAGDGFYSEAAAELLEFLDAEKGKLAG